MIPAYHISIFLDTRRAKANGKYPVKLRVFTSEPRKQKLYATVFELTEKEFKSIWKSQKPREKDKEIRLELQALENKANKEAKKLNVFSFEGFERRMFNVSGEKAGDVVNYYRQAIESYRRNQQVSTASNYDLSLKSLLDFHKKDALHFSVITPQWLKDYERFMTEAKGLSQTTVGIYLRPLRAIFNTAMDDKTILPEIYPFGRRKFTIPAPRSIKKALTKEQLKMLWEKDPSTPEQSKSKDFWFFSYMCNGMNIKDIANLKYKNISDSLLTFRRIKTAGTNKTQSPVKVYVNDFIRSVIEKYGNTDQNPDNLIFQIIDPNANAEKKHRQVNNFVRFVNQHFLIFAESAGIKEKVSSYWARHSWATNAIRSGASMEFVSEALSHSSMSTTRGYFAGFEDEQIKEISKRLMEF